MDQIIKTSTESIKNLQIPPDFLLYVKFYLKTKGLPEDTEFELSFAQDMYQQMIIDKSYDHNQPVLWEPVNEMQRLAMETEAFELYCGGKAGTGKTDLLLGLSFTEHQNSIIFRTEYSQMDTIEDRSREILRSTGARYNASPSSKRWRNIPGSRSLRFGAIKLDSDIDKYYGRPHDLICFDEIPKFQEHHYLSVWGWARSVHKDQRVRIVCTGNPPVKAGEVWVKQRWGAWIDDKHLNPAEAGELRWYVNLDGKDTEVEGPDVRITDSEGKLLTPLSRTFIPGELLDFYKGTQYEATLDSLPITLRAALRDGDFNAVRDDQSQQVISTQAVYDAFDRWDKQGKPEDTPMRNLSIDVARGGDDQTILCKRYGSWCDELIKVKGTDTKTGNEVLALVVMTLSQEEKDTLITIDLTGVGSAPHDTLIDAGYSVEGFVSSSKSSFTDASGKLGFINRRAEAWWLFKEAIEDPNSEIALPRDNEILADLTSPTWTVSGLNSKIKIESKDDIKKRLGRSTDCGDAIVMSFNSDARAETNYF